MVTRAYVGPGDEVILSEHCFLMAKVHALAQGAKLQVAPEPDHNTSVDEILKVLTPRTRMVAIASPNNPCGRCLAHAELKRLHAALRKRDPPSMRLTPNIHRGGLRQRHRACHGRAERHDDPHVLHCMGLPACEWAGATPRRDRKGAGAPALPVQRQRRRPGCSRGGGDREHAAYVRAYNERERTRVTNAVRGLGITVVPSSANFVLLVFGAEPHTAAAAQAHLLARGIIPRPVGGSPADSLRITLGLESDNDAVLRALRSFVGT